MNLDLLFQICNFNHTWDNNLICLFFRWLYTTSLILFVHCFSLSMCLCCVSFVSLYVSIMSSKRFPITVRHAAHVLAMCLAVWFACVSYMFRSVSAVFQTISRNDPVKSTHWSTHTVYKTMPILRPTHWIQGEIEVEADHLTYKAFVTDN